MERRGNGSVVATDPAHWHALEWRQIGPFRAGRVVAVAGHPTEVGTFYFGSSGGGVWKTTDAGVTWRNISDGFFQRASVGALAVAPSDPNVIYAGMGEAHIRGNVSHGDGVYRSTDGGKTWTNVGLAETRNIARVRVDPNDPDTVYVAALGHAHGPNSERGVFKSTDGGQNWRRVLYRDEHTGAIDLTIDPTNPRILYAALWQAIRRPHELVSGGPGSGIFRSTDGGETWQEIGRNPGMSQGVLGKIGLGAAPKPGRIYALVEAEDGAVFRSDDYGETWTRQSEDRNLRQRAWYFNHLFADPSDPDTVWVLSFVTWKSIDGGKTFSLIPTPHADNHDLWIDPHNSNRMIAGHDGGATVTLNGAESWSTVMNQPTVEFYHVTTDNQVPYRIYGAQQDNTTISVPSRSNLAGITPADWVEVGGGESGYIAVDPRDANVVYAGSYAGVLTRFDRRTGQRQNISPWPESSPGHGAKDVRYRFQWTYPIVISPHDPRVLYVTSNHVHRSTDEGHSWQVISPDLTRNDPSKQEPSGGPITRDNTGAEYYDTIFAFAESPVTKGVLWAGADDGPVHLSRDGGTSWQDVTPPAALLPEWALISIIEPSPHDAATAYLAATRYKHDDFRPYLLKTSDYGASWQVITGGIPADDFTRAIREDPARQGLLYAGTETGLYVSFDDGGHWQRVGGNLPVVPIHDLVVKDDDLVLATHGRAFWVLDDISPLRQLGASAGASNQLFAPRPTTRFYTNRGFGRATGPGNNYQGTGASMVTYRMVNRPDGTKKEVLLDAGQNPPDGVLVNYFLASEPEEEVTLTFLDAAANEIKTFTSRPKGNGDGKKEAAVPARAGLNRFVWNMRYPEGVSVPGAMFRSGGVDGPTAPPGSYAVRLTVGGETFTQPFEIRKDPRVPATDEDLQAQFALLLQIRDKLSEAHGAVNRIRKLRPQVEDWQQRGEAADHAPIAETAQSIAERLTEIEHVLIEPRLQVPKDPLHFPPKVNAKLAALSGVVASADARPTRQSYEVYEKLAGEIDAQVAALATLVETDVPRLNGLVRDAGFPAVP